MDITTLDFILINIVSYILGTATGLVICCKNKDDLMRSRSMDNFRNQVNDSLNHQRTLPVPPMASPVLASAPPPQNPIKLTIE